MLQQHLRGGDIQNFGGGRGDLIWRDLITPEKPGISSISVAAGFFFSRFLFLKISFASLQFNAVGYLKSATKIYNLLRFFLLSVKSEKLLANRLGDVITSDMVLFLIPSMVRSTVDFASFSDRNARTFNPLMHNVPKWSDTL